MKTALRYLLLLALPLFAADQVTKWLVMHNIDTEETLQIIPGFLNFVHVHNTGAAFGMLRNNNFFFIALAVAALVALAVFARRGAFPGPLGRTAAALLVAGILGNLTDRLLHGFVIDFLDVVLPWYGHWPAFNIADSCICVAAGLFIFDGLLAGKSPKG